jgi:predicted Rossmann fold flavoprotein
VSDQTRQFDVLVLGAGAAGLMCAIEAGKRGRRAAILERADHPGKKILISGGGRCNFTNIYCQPENFICSNPHFPKSALARYTPADFIALVEKHRIAYHEKTLGQLFCDGSAREIVGLLQEECRAAQVEVFTNIHVSEVRKPAEFVIASNHGEFRAPAVVIATGGLSIPKIGATSFGYDLARQFGLKIIEPWPGLVPLILGPEDRKHYCNLAGLSAEVVASAGNQSFREKMLFTHRGLSGPAILQISSYWRHGKPISIDLAPDQKITASFSDPKVSRNLNAAKTALENALPNRLADRWLEVHAPQTWTNAGLEDFERQIHRWQIMPAGTEGYEKAEVTAGGVDTDELSAKTMECRNVAGLYFIGEVVDVTGHLGGFNFQWAWASGAAAGRSI